MHVLHLSPTLSPITCFLVFTIFSSAWSGIGFRLIAEVEGMVLNSLPPRRRRRRAPEKVSDAGSALLETSLDRMPEELRLYEYLDAQSQ